MNQQIKLSTDKNTNGDGTSYRSDFELRDVSRQHLFRIGEGLEGKQTAVTAEFVIGFSQLVRYDP